MKDKIQLTGTNREQGPAILKELYDKIEDSIIHTIQGAPEGVIELQDLMDSVSLQLPQLKSGDLSWYILQVKHHLQATGILKISTRQKPAQLISLTRKVGGRKNVARKTPDVRITVVFSLNHPRQSPGERAFLRAMERLSLLPYVLHYECRPTTSRMTDFDFGLSIEFRNYALYEKYTRHPEYVKFMDNHWNHDVKNFLYVGYESEMKQA